MIAEDGLDWKTRVLASGPCVVHEGDGCDGPMQAHHAITQQALRRRGLEHLRWETDNGLPVCERAHRRHTLAVERIPYSALPRATVQFAVSIGCDFHLDRYYPSNLGS